MLRFLRQFAGVDADELRGDGDRLVEVGDAERIGRLQDGDDLAGEIVGDVVAGDEGGREGDLGEEVGVAGEFDQIRARAP